ncbi:MAG: hypothetical protein AAFU56_00280, partial [Pseudomonadota bacterium]
MTKIAFFFIVLFVVAFGLAWLADNPGTVAIEWPYANARIDASLMEAVVMLGVLVAIAMSIWWPVSHCRHWL